MVSSVPLCPLGYTPLRYFFQHSDLPYGHLMAQRYDIEKDYEGHWMVIDRLTGGPAEERWCRAGRFARGEADDLLDLLNARDVRERHAKGID